MWKVQISKNASKFLEKNTDIKPKILEKIKALKSWLEGSIDVSFDLRKLKGTWNGFYRLRVGKVRVILDINSETNTLRILEIDFRGDIY